jgi:hypothetical protein
MSEPQTLSPEIIEAVVGIAKDLGFQYNQEALNGYSLDKLVKACEGCGWTPEDTAQEILRKTTAFDIENRIKKCVTPFGDGTLIGLPLDDLKAAFGFIALVKAGVEVTRDHMIQAIKISDKLYDAMLNQP